MAIELVGDLFTILSVVTPEELFAVNPTEFFCADVDGAGTPGMETLMWAGQARLSFFAMSTFPLSIVDAASASPLPESADPPFPPVYPYFFSSDLLYGREHMNTVLRMVRGDTLIFTVTVVKDSAAYVLGAGVTLTLTAKWTTEDADGSAVFQKTRGAGIVVTDAANGEMTITIAPADTLSLPTSENGATLKYDVELVDGAAVYTVVRGDLHVVPDVTAGA